MTTPTHIARNCPATPALVAGLQPSPLPPALPLCVSGLVRPCVNPNDDGTWSRPNSSDAAVRTENANEYPSLARALRARGVHTVVDAGANEGSSSRLFAQLLGPKARVVAIEPSLEQYTLLTMNTRDVRERVTPLRAALWNASTSMAIRGHTSRASDATSPTRFEAAAWSTRVLPLAEKRGGPASDALPGVSLPSLLDGLCWPHLGFLKLCVHAP